MKGILTSIKRVFARQKENNIAVETMIGNEEPVRETPVSPVYQDNPLVTFYGVGPELINYKYPVNAECIKKEILNPNGVIGPAWYEQWPDAIEALRDYNNEFFYEKEHEEIREHFYQDLTLLYEKHGYYSALTLMHSIDVQYDYDKMRICAENGVAEGMTQYAGEMIRKGRNEDAERWMLEAAEKDEVIAMMSLAISYNYGTFTRIDKDEAARWYKASLNRDRDDSDYIWDFFASTNLGVLYVDAGYFRTALRYFELADRQRENIKEDDFGLEIYDKNTDKCRNLLENSYSLRRKRALIQSNTSSIPRLFDLEYQSHLTVALDDKSRIGHWKPKDISDVDLDDLREESEATALANPHQTNNKENFVFPSISVEIRNPEIFGTKREIIFLEKNCHAQLNDYIQTHFDYLRTCFRKLGLLFIYLPAHFNSSEYYDDLLLPEDEHEELGILDDDVVSTTTARYMEGNASLYWNYMFSKESLPNDCAGFLHYKPATPYAEVKLYDYYFFPFLPSTDFEKAFATFFAYLNYIYTGEEDTLINEEEKEIEDTINNCNLLITNEYRIMIVANDGQMRKEVAMPALSRVLYFFFLRHPEGIPLKQLVDYRDELLAIYRKVSDRQILDKNIDSLVDPTTNSINEKLSRIRKAFADALEGLGNDYTDFLITGTRGNPYRITLDRQRVEWEKKIEI